MAPTSQETALKFCNHLQKHSSNNISDLWTNHKQEISNSDEMSTNFFHNNKNTNNNSNKVVLRRWNQDYTVEHLPNVPSTANNNSNLQRYKLSKMFALPQIDFFMQNKSPINSNSIKCQQNQKILTKNNVSIIENREKHGTISHLVENGKLKTYNDCSIKTTHNNKSNKNQLNFSTSTKLKYCNQSAPIQSKRRESAALLVETLLPPSSNKTLNTPLHDSPLFLVKTNAYNKDSTITTTPTTSSLTNQNVVKRELNSNWWWKKNSNTPVGSKTTSIQSNSLFIVPPSEKYKLRENAFEVIHLENNKIQKTNKKNVSQQNSKEFDLLTSSNKSPHSLRSLNFLNESHAPLCSTTSSIIDNYSYRNKLLNQPSTSFDNEDDYFKPHKDRAGALLEFSKSFKKIKRAKTVSNGACNRRFNQNRKKDKKKQLNKNNIINEINKSNDLLKSSKSEPSLRPMLCILFRDFLLLDDNTTLKNILSKRVLKLTASNCICTSNNCAFVKTSNHIDSIPDECNKLNIKQSTNNSFLSPIFPYKSNEINETLAAASLLSVPDTENNEFNTRRRSLSLIPYTDEQRQASAVLTRKELLINYNKVKLSELYERSKRNKSEVIIDNCI